MFRYYSGSAMIPSVYNFCGVWLENWITGSHRLRQESSAEIGTSCILRVICLGFTVDASKLPSQALLIIDESSKMCVVERCRGGRRDLFYWSILAIFFQSLGVISRVAHSTVLNYYFNPAVAGHNKSSSSPTTHTA